MCLSNRTFRSVPGHRRWSARISLLAILVLACPPGITQDAYAGQQAAQPEAVTEPTAKQAPPPQAVELVNRGNGLLDRDDFAGAEKAYRNAIRRDSNLAAAHRGLGVALWRQGQLGKAWQELSTVARLEPSSPEAHFELGQLAWQIYSSSAGAGVPDTGLSGDDFRSLAFSEVEKATALEPHNFNMRLQLSQMELDAGEKHKAQADALGAVSLASSAAERARAHVAMARALFATGDEVRAEAEYKKAIDENPSSGEAYLGLGQLAVFRQTPDEARKYFHQAIQASPDLAPAYAALGRLLVQAHQRAEAMAMLQKAVALDARDVQSEYELGQLLMQSGEAERARALFKKIVDARPDFLPAGEQLAMMRLRQGDVQGAVAEAQSLVARKPQAAEGHRVLALAFWRQRRTDASLAECAQALATDPHSTSMLALQALELWQTKRRADARRVLKDVAHSDPGILSPVTFCRQIVCGDSDVPQVRDFLRQNRWILEPSDIQ